MLLNPSRVRPRNDLAASLYAQEPVRNTVTMKPDSSPTRFITLQELCERLGLSKSRFYTLQKVGIFPEAIRGPTNNRPVFDSALVEQCLGIVQNRVGANGQPITFNRKTPSRKPRKRESSSNVPKHTDLVESLASLGLITTTAKVEEALATLPDRGSALTAEDLIRELFLVLRKSA
jgi:hypothetical protein